MPDVADFFKKKKPWSRYKDLILSYYLKPYLAKVARLGKPIAIVDCFAGAGRFQDNENGSPLIIAEQLRVLHDQGTGVRGVFIESDPTLCRRLHANLAGIPFPLSVRQGDFREHIDEIVDIATTHTVFIYLDPFAPGDLLFNDLEAVYEKLRTGRSVETLLNFPSRGFLRRARGLGRHATLGGTAVPDHPEVVACDEIAGGVYWQKPIFDETLSTRARIDNIAEGYASHMSRWFKWRLAYPIKEKYKDKWPKYHLIFGSRHPDAIDLMNRAMVTARREFVGAEYIEGNLFENLPREEVPEPAEVERTIVDTMRSLKPTTWKLLRIHATTRSPCKYTDSEFNKGIKAAIKAGKIGSACNGKRIENDAQVWHVTS